MIREIETNNKAHKGINFFQEADFLMEIIFQIRMAEHAFDRLKASANHSGKMEVWGSIQSILIAAGNVSKILWPGKDKYEARGVQLRTLLKIEGNNPIKDRKFRNHFEHFDERLQKWTENRRGYFDFVMNPSMQSLAFENISRGYDTLDYTLVFQGERLDLNAVVEALKEIKGRCIK